MMLSSPVALTPPLLLYAPPPDTQLIRLPLKEGRWLLGAGLAFPVTTLLALLLYSISARDSAMKS